MEGSYDGKGYGLRQFVKKVIGTPFFNINRGFPTLSIRTQFININLI